MTDEVDEQPRRIVVGVDGSPGSRSALRWAITHARLIGAEVDAVIAWQDPVMVGYTYGVPALYEADALAAGAEKTVDQTVAEVTADMDAAVDVRTMVFEGHAADVLLRAAVGSQLLVVGSHGHGTFAGMVLGSVSQHCVQHAPCPVVVVPDARPPAR